MVIDFDGDSFETALVKMSRALGMFVRMPAHHVGVGQPSEECRQTGIVDGANDELPMIWQPAICQDRQEKQFIRLGKDTLEPFIVLGLFK